MDQKDKIKTFSRDELKELLKKQKEKVREGIEKVLQSKSSIRFKAKDLLRGKSTFERVEDIVEARKKIVEKIE